MKTDYKVGDRVKIIDAEGGELNGSFNKVGDIGYVANFEDDLYRVQVVGRENYSNWQRAQEMELLESVEDIATEYDHINPDHYKTGSVEVFDMMVSIYGVEKAKVFCELNAFKYRMRLGSKPNNSVEQELEKIKWYESKLKEL